MEEAEIMRTKGKLILILFFSLFFVSSSILFVQQREAAPVKLDKLSDRLFQILGGRGANVGLYIGDEGVLVIDAKMTEESVGQTLEEIKKATDKPITYLVNTHSDGDHVAGNRFFPRAVTIISHENCRQEFFHPRRDGEPSEWNNPELTPFIPSLTFRDKMNIYLGARKVELWYFGIGHTTGDIVIYFPEEKTAFMGDQIFIGRPQLIHSYKGGNSFEYVKTITRMLQTLEAETFCSGHSEPVDRSTVEQQLEEMKKIQEKIKFLRKQGKSLEEMKKEFEENQARLVETIFNEIKSSRQ
jgi:cyclase